MATEAKRYIVKNANDPTPGHVTEEKESELEEFIDYSKVIMGTLGHKVFMPVNSPTLSGDTDKMADTIFFLKNSKVDARGKITSDGFIVLKDSKIALSPTKSCPERIKRLREFYHGKIDDNYSVIDEGKLLKTYESNDSQSLEANQEME